MVRASGHRLPLASWPDLTDSSSHRVERWRGWLQAAWSREDLAAAVEHASPVLARQARAICTGGCEDPRRVRRTASALVRYALRMHGRATPFGLFAGVAPVEFGNELVMAWGDQHRAFARADGAWLADVIKRFEACPAVLHRLSLVANNCAFRRGERLIVPYPPRSDRAEGPAAEVSLRFTSAVRLVVAAARAPVRGRELVEKVRTEFPQVAPSRIEGLVASLVGRGVLLSALHAPAGTFDAFGHLMQQVTAAGVGEIPEVAHLTAHLREVQSKLIAHNAPASSAKGRRLRAALRTDMLAVSTVVEQPVAVDSRLACTLVLPHQVARTAEEAASALARLSPFPHGLPAWKTYHNRFFERYGIGSLVPVRDLVDADIGLGVPDGYLDAEPEAGASVSGRDRHLLALAQQAALEGRDEVQLDEQLISALAVGEPDQVRLPPHLELRFRLQALDTAAVDRGDFTLVVVSPSRGIGTTTGRFLGLLAPQEQAQARRAFAHLPTSDPSAHPVQVSFTPLSRSDSHVTRAPDVLPDVISLAEHRPDGARLIALDDLAVGCDPQRLYLASLSRQQRLEPMAPHALDLRAHTPPLARFLLEIAKATSTVVTPFAWGAASTLPFLPRVRYGRIILTPARWSLRRADVPDSRSTWPQWREALEQWRHRNRLPDWVALTEGDRELPLNLTEDTHLAILRSHLAASESATLTEAQPGADGWLNGHAHEITVPLRAARPARWPAAPPVSTARLVTRDHGHVAGASQWLMAKIYSHTARHPEILGQHLPDLFARWEQPPTWWYMRYRDPRWHLRLRIALADVSEFGTAAARIAEWATELRRHGLVGDVQFATSYPEIGRWGTAGGMETAEAVFAADSAALATTFAQPARPHPQALAAANFVAIATALTGSTAAGMDWLIRNGHLPDPDPLDREVRSEALNLADPTDDWSGLRSAPGGTAIHATWAARARALSAYRDWLRTSDDGTDPDAVLDSLLHAHHIRAAGIDKPDERTCIRLARAAALAWKARSA
ncbi:lantibiotic dehydratase [Streptomyces sp. NBC_01187]|uniref:lantibiotic dehydratase n=1 Tax=Streptomyces sp. NBC_01187 TaxID=2903766 RepID=UPI00386D6AC0|nr:lantibiotic dehydratase [Streptomyces sp. NBC_01187]